MTGPPLLDSDSRTAQRVHTASIQFVEGTGESRDRIELVGLPASEVTALAEAKLNDTDWSAFFSVHVTVLEKESRDGLPPLLGSYDIRESTIVFTPRYPLRRGLSYSARFDPASYVRRFQAISGAAQSPGLGATTPVVVEILLPKPKNEPATTVLQVFPTRARLPENQLKFYLHFSAPMSRGEAYQRVHLLDADGQEIDLPFLELDEELWDASATRFTLLLDPGRIKRGLKPREEVGPVFEEGKVYTLVIDRDWLDAAGNPLAKPFQKPIEVGPPDDQQPDPNSWNIQPPKAATTEPLVVLFPEPLDHAMLYRVIVSRDPDGKLVKGRIEVDSEETRWTLIPETAWKAGAYTLEVQTDLEDLAGNSIARVFDVDLFAPISRSMKAETWSVPFLAR